MKMKEEDEGGRGIVWEMIGKEEGGQENKCDMRDDAVLLIM